MPKIKVLGKGINLTNTLPCLTSFYMCRIGRTLCVVEREHHVRLGSQGWTKHRFLQYTGTLGLLLLGKPSRQQPLCSCNDHPHPRNALTICGQQLVKIPQLKNVLRCSWVQTHHVLAPQGHISSPAQLLPYSPHHCSLSDGSSPAPTPPCLQLGSATPIIK